MKKIFFLAAAAMMSAAMYADLQVATFEDIMLAKVDTVWQGADAPVIGWNNWKSGSYNFLSYYGGNSGYGDYYSAFTVSNQMSNTYEGLQDAYHSACGGAYEGNNFAVWNENYYGADSIMFDNPQVFKGFWINNTAYAVNSMCNGDGYAKKFGKDDWFKLRIYGSYEGEFLSYIDVYLAKDGKYINQWTYVDLQNLGHQIEGLKFQLSSSDESYGFMNTPAYFAMDNFGAAKPEGYVEPEKAEFDLSEGIHNTDAAVKAVKVIRDGQVVILRGEKVYNVLGKEL